jgi:hypothetical protein
VPKPFPCSNRDSDWTDRRAWSRSTSYSVGLASLRTCSPQIADPTRQPRPKLRIVSCALCWFDSKGIRRPSQRKDTSSPGPQTLFLLASPLQAFAHGVELFLRTELAQHGYEGYAASEPPGRNGNRLNVKLTNGWQASSRPMPRFHMIRSGAEAVVTYLKSLNASQWGMSLGEFQCDRADHDVSTGCCRASATSR